MPVPRKQNPSSCLAISNIPFKTLVFAVLVTVICAIYFLYSYPNNWSSWRNSLANIETSHVYHRANKLGSIRRSARNHGDRVSIPIVAVACGDRSDELITMLKSVLTFSQDAHLDATIFVDDASAFVVASKLTGLKMVADSLRWDFTFRLHLKKYPNNTEGWFTGQRFLCSTLRLFFPSILENFESILYLDTDVVIMSNLTEMWENFKAMQRREPQVIAAFSEILPEPAKGLYSEQNRVPFYGHSGLNAGVIFMNLTRMRDFHLEDHSYVAYGSYKDKLYLPDQDIYNIVFHSFPQRVQKLSCTYNFHRGHCGKGQLQKCDFHEKEEGPVCFCHEALRSGVRIVHGAGRSFSREWMFLYELQQAFAKIDLSREAPLEMISGLKAGFKKFQQKPACFSLTANALYSNAFSYLTVVSRHCRNNRSET